MANLGPMAGQLSHFVNYAPEPVPYAHDRYEKEYDRLLGVMNTRLDAEAIAFMLDHGEAKVVLLDVDNDGLGLRLSDSCQVLQQAAHAREAGLGVFPIALYF